MPLKKIIIGSAPNDGTGDALRTAFEKTNANFEALASAVIAKLLVHPAFASRHHDHDNYVPRYLNDSAPSEPPPVFGAIWVDSSQKRVYLATGTESTVDWREIAFK